MKFTKLFLLTFCFGFSVHAMDTARVKTLKQLCVLANTHKVAKEMTPENKDSIMNQFNVPGLRELIEGKFNLIYGSYKSIKILKGHSDQVRHLTFDSATQKLYSASLDGHVGCWDSQHYKHYKMYQHGSEVYDLFLYSRAVMISACHNGNIILWNQSQDKLIKEFQAHSAQVTMVSGDEQNKLLLTCSADNTAKLWEIKDMANPKLLHTFKHNNIVWVAKFIENTDKIVTGSQDKKIKIWNRNTGECERVMEEHIACVSDVAIHGNDLYSASCDTTIQRWQLPTGTRIKKLGEQGRKIMHFGLIQDSLLPALSNDNTIEIWDLQLQQVVKSINTPKKTTSFCFLEFPSVVAFGQQNGTITIAQSEFAQNCDYWLQEKEKKKNARLLYLIWSLWSKSVDSVIC